MKLNPLTNTVSFVRGDLVADLTRYSKGMITSLDEVQSVAHLALDRVLSLTKLDEASVEEIHDTVGKLFTFIESGTDTAALSLRIGATTYTAELS